MSSKNGHWMPMYWADYIADTMHLSTEEHGAYLLLIGTYWRRGSPLPDDPKFLANVAKVSRQRWAIMKNVVGTFFEISDGSWKHKRLDLEILKSCERIASASASANARWHASDMLPTSTPTKEGNIISFSNGKVPGSERVTIKDPQERLSRFQKWLAGKLGSDGWVIVAAAADPSDKNYLTALIRCQEVSRSFGKGWPKQWPAQ